LKIYKITLLLLALGVVFFCLILTSTLTRIILTVLIIFLICLLVVLDRRGIRERYFEESSRMDRETSHFSYVQRDHPSYQKIVRMGEATIGLMLKEIRDEPNCHIWWRFEAIDAIVRLRGLPPIIIAPAIAGKAKKSVKSIWNGVEKTASSSSHEQMFVALLNLLHTLTCKKAHFVGGRGFFYSQPKDFSVTFKDSLVTSITQCRNILNNGSSGLAFPRRRW